MAQDVIEIVEREVEVVEVLERGLMGMAGPIGPQANINYIVVSSSQAVSNRQLIAANTLAGSFTLTLPSNPAAGDAIDIFDYSDTFDTNALTIGHNGKNIEGEAEDLVANVEGAYFTLIFTGDSRGWQVVPRYGQGGLQNVFTTEGDLIYRGSSAEARLGIGSAGDVLKVNSGATAPEWGALPDTIDDYVVITTSQTIANGARLAADTSGGAFTLTLPLTPNDGDTFYILDFAKTFDTNNLTLDRNGSLIEGAADNMVCNVEGSSFKMVYTGVANGGWQMIPFFGVAGVSTVSGTAPIVSSGGTTPTLSITAATTSAAGSMSSEDKTKLDGIATGAEVNVQSNWTESNNALDSFILNKPATFTPSSHTHGSITNDGKVGAVSGLPVVTTTDGAVTTLALGTANQVLRVNSGATGVEFGAGFDAASPPAIGSTTPNTGAFTSLSANNGTLTASAPVLDLAQTWNNAAVAFTAINLDITNTASAFGSQFLQFSIAGVPQVRFQRNFSTPVLYFGNSHTGIGSASTTLFVYANGGATASFGAGGGGMNLRSDSPYSWASSTNLTAANDLSLFRDAADTLAQRRATNPQVFRIYNTYTDASNHERGFMQWNSNNFDIGCEADGTGTLRNVRIKTDATGGASGTGYIEFGGSATINTIKSVGGTANGALYIYSEGTLRMLIGGSSGTRFHQTIYPNANQAIDIGLTGNRWRDVFCRSVDLTGDLILTTTTGTKIGTATTQKLGFFNATPVVQQAAVADATDAATAITQLNDLLARLRTLGLIAT
jgi:hypothetical protein